MINFTEGFNPDYFPELANLEKNNFWFRVHNCLIIWTLKRFFFNAKNFLEIGCGTGYVLSSLSNSFPELALYGSEIYSAGLDYAAKRLNISTLFQMDARTIPFVEEFDVIGAFDVIEHIKEDREVLLQMYKAIKPGGGIILTVPQHQFLWSQQDEHACHVRRYSSKELKDKVSAAGFKIIRTTSFVSFLLPLMVISRLFKRKYRANYDALAELRLPNFINKFFELILKLEYIFIQLGINFSMGGSLLIIAKKPNNL